ncbi:HTH-type transcriptional regulator SutR [Bosea sp. 62]|uniref:helix-turn-helix domain-containing protein n=1 Tax=unclassified Bosea (in: a-proteobacteria) TaxID=2653178 RepID=UPI00125880EF|nr:MULTISPECIES: XRE family transcriptional regulator [unclassified Bosea (in: a-proteobacteria)]CAD5254691.1 HTH-type transcriptional regulator SutR [Bosea sp. 46]CAD5266644.1 HTH-type transcriptional regulator SutR [Bosea sp. 21B]CAD5272700.1 HTH-type transcriptional regulator SutR [Bosea sp. 7B]VVT56034.1 HTH-type transcriptional regulator SutR [Bosea sp. EC-HK365B]VXB81633.1 HTH-type transcriptional regulator SutR [Bosea sp. 29B]
MKPVGPVETPKLLKAIRSERGWSLDQTAARTGVSKAMLGQIERGESAPTIATLWKIATGLGVPMTALLEADGGSGDVLLLRDAAELRVRPSQEGMQRALVFPYEARFGFELYELTFAAGFESISEPHDIGVVEHITVQHGEIELLVEEEWHPLRQGQSLRFPADRRHGYRNRTAEEALVMDIIHYRFTPSPKP